MGAWDLGKEMLENGENHDSTALRTASLGNTPASGASGSRGVQPGKDRMGRWMTLPPGRLIGQTRRHALPELLGVLII